MAAHRYRSADLWHLVAYIRSLGVPARNIAVVAEQKSKLERVSVSYADLVAAEEPGDDWLTHGGAYGSNRHSSLAQINARNVNMLGVRWMHQLVGVSDKIESTPIVRDGVMYFTAPHGRVVAVDAASGRQLWEYVHQYTYVGGGEGPLDQNRGVLPVKDGS